MKNLVMAAVLGMGLALPASALADTDSELTMDPVALGGDAAPAVDAATPADAGPSADMDAGGVPATAPAEPEADLDTLVSLAKAVRGGEWRLAASLVLALLMFALARARDEIGWFRGDRGGAVLVALLAFGGALSTALATPVPLDFKLIAGTFGVMWTAVGGVQWAKRLLWPKD